MEQGLRTEIETDASQEWVVRDLEIRRAAQTIRHRETLVWAVIAFYTLTLLATFVLFYLAGAGIFAFADNVLIALSGVLVGEVGVGAVLMQMVKSIFTLP